ncbi:MAG: hypothetical protein QOH96_1483 [Blastocatellia bacterium]|nr:hypothetical protein [Blastocatellia bacterium]
MFRLLIFVSFAFTAHNALGLDNSTCPSPLSVEIHGLVRYAQGGSPADKVVVRLESYDSGGPIEEVFTDRTGKFRFSDLSPAQYIVTIHASGFKDAQQRVDLKTASSNYLIFQLMPADLPGSPPPAGSGGLLNARVPAEAQKEYERASEALPNANPARIAKAIRHLEKAVTLYPNFLEAQMKLGTAYMDTKQWDKAEKALRRTLEIDPKTPNAYFALGEVYASEEKYSDAESILREGFKLHEKSWNGHLALGHVYWNMGNWLKAGPEVGRALQLKPDSAEGHLLAGNILLKARRPQNALVEFEEYLRLAPAGEFAGQARGIAAKLKAALPDSSDTLFQKANENKAKSTLHP